MAHPSLADLWATRPVFDAHADSLQRALDLGHDLGQVTPGHLDLPRGRQGGLGSLVFVSWVDPSYAEHRGLAGARARAAALLACFHELRERHPEALAWAGNGQLARQAQGAGQLAGIPGIEGGHAIEESLETLEWFFERGIRVLTLVWNNHLSWIRSCQDGAGPGIPAGLSDFGRQVVRRMNELGMVIDLSHAGRQSFYDALDASDQPVIASHSGCTTLNDHPRNMNDDQLRALAGNGGVIGIVFCTPFLDAEARAAEQALRDSAGYQALRADSEAELFLAQSEFLQREAPPLSIDRVVDHIVHAVEVAGIDHVGLGSDYDGIQRTPAGLESAAHYVQLGEALERRGFSVEEIAKIAGGNMLRVYERVTGPGTRAQTQELVRLEHVPS